MGVYIRTTLETVGNYLIKIHQSDGSAIQLVVVYTTELHVHVHQPRHV